MLNVKVCQLPREESSLIKFELIKHKINRASQQSFKRIEEYDMKWSIKSLFKENLEIFKFLFCRVFQQCCMEESICNNQKLFYYC